MAAHSPLLAHHQQVEAPLAPYGPARAGVFLVDRFAPLELEYGRLRSGCVLMDLPSRGVIEVAGADRHDFLNRLLTQRLSPMNAWTMRPSFWLNRKGRIDADLHVVALDDRILMDCDIHAVARTIETLDAFVIADDVQLTDVSEQTHRLALHGPHALRTLNDTSEHVSGAQLSELAHGNACAITVNGRAATVFRADQTGDPGLELIAALEDAPDIYADLLGGEPEDVPDSSNDSGRAPIIHPCGWHAFNMARIEAGTPLYMLDFGPDSLPHETSVVASRVDTAKGCYLGQEIVARMQSHGGARKRLVGIRCEGETQPATGASVTVDGGAVGAVTSSAISPMLGSATICFAMLKSTVEAGATVTLEAEDGHTVGVVQEELSFWRRG